MAVLLSTERREQIKTQIKVLRAQGQTQRMIALLVGVAQSTIGYLENGSKRPRRPSGRPRKLAPASRKEVFCLKCERLFKSKVSPSGRLIYRLCPSCREENQGVLL